MSMTTTLSENKRNRAINLLSSILQRKSISAATLESLLGFLNHCCQVVPVGRPFLRHIFNMLNKVQNSNRAKIRIATLKSQSMQRHPLVACILTTLVTNLHNSGNPKSLPRLDRCLREKGHRQLLRHTSTRHMSLDVIGENTSIGRTCLLSCAHYFYGTKH